MQREELRDGGALLGQALGEIAEIARDVHRGVAGRMFGLVGGPALPVKLLHDGIAGIAYGSTRLGVRLIPAALGGVGAATAPPSTESLHDGPRGHFFLNALNGFWGDRLAEQRPSLAPHLTLRTHAGVLRHKPANVVHDLGDDATGRIVVFLHGLCENDLMWTLGALKNYGDPTATHGSRLRDEQGWTPLYASYNTGLRISDNGRRLAGLLEDLTARWPVPVEDIALVGHSMGGLVARSAAHRAHADGQAWIGALRHVVGLGAPHLGAPLERFVNNGTRLLGRLPETRPFATWLNNRSVGIKDLRHGAIVEDDWNGFELDDPADHCTAATLLPGVAYSVVAATLSQRPDGLFKHDLLVQHSSAHGSGPVRRIEFETDRLFHIGRRHHFDLLNDPQVYEQLARWLATPPQVMTHSA
jgi:pimeloyl-ACP methyl ester carboxylesterase